MTVPLIRAATLAPRSFDREARTVDAIASTGADVARPGFTERLPVENADLSGFVGAPVLDAHRMGSTRDVLGVVEAARLEGGALVVTLRFSGRAAVDDVLDDIAAGVLRGVSLGYRIDAHRDARGQGGAVIRTATRWTPLELSLVPVPADPGATIRSRPMPDPIPNAPAPAPAPPPAPTATRAEVNAQIRSIARTAGLSAEWSDAQIDAETGVDAARAAAFAEMERRSAAPIQRPSVGFSHDAPEVTNARMAEALFARAVPSHELSDPARQFAGMTMVDMGREILRRSGVSVAGMSPAGIATRALSTSDFPIILGDAVGRGLRMAYSAAPSGLKAAARQTTARDFRAKHRIQLSEAPQLLKVGEGGEITFGAMAEAKESYAIDTYARRISITRKAIVNDDLGAFDDVAARMGRAAAAFEAKFLADLLTSNPVMEDGAALFHASHGNLAAAGGALSANTLTAAKVAMRTQTGISDELISVTPAFLIVPPALEDLALTLVTQTTPASTDDVNPHANLSLIVDPRLTGTGWYLAARPAEIDGLEYAYLEGAPGPQTESRQGFEIEGVEIKVRLDFGGAFVDHRGWHRNDGA